ncbi:MAG: nucleoside-triphosphatase [Chloroflexota bacterium]|nr:nucleoside-triphosphatase [Chloroflexota bacterium]
MDTIREGTRIAIAGFRESGKTSLLIDFVKGLREWNLEVQGVIEAGIFEGDRKVAIEVMDLAAGESRMLAQLSTEVISELQFGDWTFFPAAFEWANERLAKIVEPDVFILDEVGPLELEQGKGLQAGLRSMSAGEYGLGIMTIRPKCLEGVMELFPDLLVYSLNNWDKESLLKDLFRIVITKF